MFAQIAYYEIFGLPFVVILGILGYITFLCVATLAILIKKGKLKIPFYWHWRLAYVAISIVTLHALLIIFANN